MKRKWLQGLIGGLAVLALVVAVGCSSDDDEKNAVGTVTPEEQMELIDELVGELGGDPGAVGGTVMPLMAMQAGAGQWDGFSCEDFDFEEFPVGKLAFPGGGNVFPPVSGDPLLAAAPRPGLAGMIQSGFRMATAQGEPVCGYNESNERWEVLYDETIRETMEGIPFSLDVKMTVYVQYISPGGYQDVPDETTTGLKQDFDIDLEFEADVSEEGMDMGLDLALDVKSSMSLTGLNSPTATMNGKTDVGTDIDMLMEGDMDPNSPGLEKMTVVGGFELGTESKDVRFAIDPEAEEVCPTSGRVDADLKLDIAMEAEG